MLSCGHACITSVLSNPLTVPISIKHCAREILDAFPCRQAGRPPQCPLHVYVLPKLHPFNHGSPCFEYGYPIHVPYHSIEFTHGNLYSKEDLPEAHPIAIMIKCYAIGVPMRSPTRSLCVPYEFHTRSHRVPIAFPMPFRRVPNDVPNAVPRYFCANVHLFCNFGTPKSPKMFNIVLCSSREPQVFPSIRPSS
jgi:hypothetical protein